MSTTASQCVSACSTWRFPKRGVVLYSATAYDAAGENGGQAGYKFIDGEQEALYFFDTSSARQINHAGTVEVNGSEVTARVPWPKGQVDKWSAAITVDGVDVAQCPDELGYVDLAHAQ